LISLRGGIKDADEYAVIEAYCAGNFLGTKALLEEYRHRYGSLPEWAQKEFGDEFVDATIIGDDGADYEPIRTNIRR